MDSPLIVLVLVILVGAAHIRINNLQDRLDGKKPEDTEKIVLPPSPAQAKIATKVTRAVPAKPSAPNPWLKWLATDWPMKLGAFLLLLAFAWLTTYAFINNWIGPMGRIGLGVAAGLLIMVLGEWRIRKYSGQGAVFLSLGAATVLVTLFAARNVYEFFTPLTALLGMFAVVLWMGISSLKHQNQALSIVGLLMGATAPMLINSPIPSFLGLFSYLFVLCLGSVFVGLKAKWPTVSLLSFLAVFFYSWVTPIVNENTNAVLGLCILFLVLFYISSFYSLWTQKRSNGFDLTLVIGNGILSLAWLHANLPTNWESTGMAVAALLLLALTYLLFRRMGQEKILYPYLVTAAVLLSYSASIELDGAWLTLALTWGGAVLIVLSTLVTKDPAVGLKLSPLLLPGLASGVNSYDNNLWGNTLLNKDFLTLVSQTLLLLGLGHFLHKNGKTFWIHLILTGIQATALAWLAGDLFHTELAKMNLIATASLIPFMGLVAFLFKDRQVSRLLPLLLLPSAVASVQSIENSAAWATGIWHADFAVLLSLTVALLSIGMIFNHYKEEEGSKIFFVASGIYAMALVWLSSDALIQDPNLHITVSLGIYTLVGLFFNIRGVLKDEKASRIAGGVLIGLVVARLLIVDVWEMAIGAKVITFFIIGALLISTAFFNKKLSPVGQPTQKKR